MIKRNEDRIDSYLDGAEEYKESSLGGKSRGKIEGKDVIAADAPVSLMILI